MKDSPRKCLEGEGSYPSSDRVFWEVLFLSRHYNTSKIVIYIYFIEDKQVSMAFSQFHSALNGGRSYK